MKQKPTLVIIPGIGDDLAIYKTFARRWERLGYDAHVIPFGWAENSAPLGSKLNGFLEKIDALGTSELYLIGVSAGGTAAITAMARRMNKVKKVIAVCSPLDTMFSLQNPLLADSIEQTRYLLLHFNDEQKAKLLSVFALYDQTVDTRLSRSPGIRTLRIPMILHPLTIYVALMVYARRLDAFFKSNLNTNVSLKPESLPC